ncbi:MAG: GGDEF domain-containing protein [Xanthobacteraceae bacterium]
MEPTVVLSSSVAGSGEQRFALLVIAVSTLAFLALAPFAAVPLPPMPAFIPIYQSALVFNDIVTAVFLLNQQQFMRTGALTVLAGGYLFTALMSILHGLTFPGLFSPTGLLSAGPQTTAWLYMFWHGGFPLFVIGYAACSAGDSAAASRHAATALVPALVIAAVLGAVFLATRGQAVLPVIMQGNRHTANMGVVVWSVWLLSLAALAMLARRRPYSVLDLWLIVTMCAWLFDIALSAALDNGRYDLGFYVGRIYGLLAASFILIVLLTQTSSLYVQLMRLRDSDRLKAEELRRLSTIDPLTGIANRRAFEEALDQEWRRMMRHSTPLSLLMIDVDYFKRFNDAYGHVAGDQCLRAVAQAFARRTRRAGELAARYDGEEFAVLLPHIDAAAARRLGELICQTVREQQIPHEGSAVASHVTISVGAACIAALPESAGAQCRDVGTGNDAPSGGGVALIKAADRALYEAKLFGRDRVVASCQDDMASAAALPVANTRLSSAA